jgi:Anti-sigma-K factor rskA/Putative zinc-finger
MARSEDRPRDRHWPQARPHEEFLELCALSTTGELTEGERHRLQDHLGTCPQCREALKEFETVADVGAPLLASALSSQLSETPRPAREDDVEAMPIALADPAATGGTNPEATEKRRGLGFGHRNGRNRTLTSWKYAWVPFAAAVVLMAALGIYLYQFGRNKGQEVALVTRGTSDAQLEVLEQRMSDAAHERQLLKADLAQRDGLIAELRGRIQRQDTDLAEIRSTQTNLEQSLQKGEIEKQQVAEERAVLAEKLDTSQLSLRAAQSELDSLREQRSRNESSAESLEAQIQDLNAQLHERDQMLDKQQDLLAHDRDIRDLMGARDLYIAEVYDVARDGATQKPYGRIFYTKGKSLVFYAYDLDQQASIKNAATFQAWGRRGPDKQQALSLGIFYRDNASKKRWVLKFDDPVALEHIDAVFVTVEPNGGSHKPTGKSLLFASLRIEPNHP